MEQRKNFRMISIMKAEEILVAREEWRNVVVVVKMNLNDL